MTERDLDTLKTVSPPDPAPDARARAVQLAMQAYEQAGRGEQKNFADNTQGSHFAARLTSILTATFGRWIMEKRMLLGTVAAGVLLFPLAAQFAWQASQPRYLQPPGETQTANLNDGNLSGRTGKADKQEGETRQLMEPEAKRASAVDSRHQASEQAAPVSPPAAILKTEDPANSVADAAASAPAARNRPAPLTEAISGVVAPAPLPQDVIVAPQYERSGDKFNSFESNPLKLVTEEPVSTFSIDVDTASYAFVRRALKDGALPPKDAVRVEEMINYFSYDYPRPETANTPFKATVAVYPTPWNSNTKLLHIGIKGHDIVPETRPRSNLVFLIDVSGSMQDADKLPLLKSAFRLLVDRLDENDTVSIVTYAGRAGTVLEPTKASNKATILAALDGLHSGGSTAGAEGIRQAYALAEQAFIENGVNRVMLATDGDFNVGISDPEELKTYIEKKRESGIFLSVMGFGEGNYNDALMQTLAQNGNGTAAYIDTLSEAQKVLVDEAGSTLFPIAKDVKIQIEFNPAQVSEYRLIGYETRALNREDFNNDKVDAGEIGSGHTVTAIYEITPRDAGKKYVDDLRYVGSQPRAPGGGGSDEYAFLKLRYKMPKADTSTLVALPVTHGNEVADVAALSADLRFAASVAAFGQKLRGVPFVADFSYDDVLNLASGARGADPYGYRNEFLGLVRLAKSLDSSNR